MKLLHKILGRKNVFKNITINLTGPICRCDEQDLWWNTPRGDDGTPTLQIGCKTCKTTLTVGNTSFKAAFHLDDEYPKGRAERKDAKILQLVPAPAPQQEEKA